MKRTRKSDKLNNKRYAKRLFSLGPKNIVLPRVGKLAPTSPEVWVGSLFLAKHPQRASVQLVLSR